MSVCEKCWRDAGGDPFRYEELLRERADKPCTPDEQSGKVYTRPDEAEFTRQSSASLGLDKERDEK